jgi:hypothetical protein
LSGQTESDAKFVSHLLIQINATDPRTSDQRAMWENIATAPFDRDLELAVMDRGEVHSLIFACRRILGGWINSETRQRIDVRPTHWREWGETAVPAGSTDRG